MLINGNIIIEFSTEFYFAKKTYFNAILQTIPRTLKNEYSQASTCRFY